MSNAPGCEGLKRLREVIHRVACKMQDSNLHEPMIGKKVLAYDVLLEFICLNSNVNNPDFFLSPPFDLRLGHLA